MPDAGQLGHNSDDHFGFAHLEELGLVRFRSEYVRKIAECKKAKKALQTQGFSRSTSGTRRGISRVPPGHSRRDTGRASKKEGRTPCLSRVHWVSLFPEALEFVDKGAAADAEGFGRLGAVEVMFAQGL